MYAKVFDEKKDVPPWWEQVLWRLYDATGVAGQPGEGYVDTQAVGELGGGGFVSFTADARLAALVSAPTLLDDCVIHVCTIVTDGGSMTPVAAYANRARCGTLWSGAVPTVTSRPPAAPARTRGTRGPTRSPSAERRFSLTHHVSTSH